MGQTSQQELWKSTSGWAICVTGMTPGQTSVLSNKLINDICVTEFDLQGLNCRIFLQSQIIYTHANLSKSKMQICFDSCNGSISPC